MADTTPRGYPFPEGDDVWRASAEDDGAAPWKNLAEAVDADVAAVEAAAAGGTAGVAGDLADHEAATTSVHGIADTSLLVVTSDARLTDTRTPTDGTVTLAKIAAGGLAPTAITGTAVVDNDARLTNARTPTAHKSTHAIGGTDVLTPADIGAPYAAITTSAVGVTWSRLTPVLTISDTATVTLPAAASNTGSVATIINIGTGTVTIARSGSNVIAGSLTSVTIPGRGTLRLVSDGTGWRVIDGSYSSSAVGLATYEWNHVAPGWRLVKYNSGWRDVSSLLVNGWALASADGRAEVCRTLDSIQAVFNLGGLAQTASTVLTLPTGFRPYRNSYGLRGSEGLNGTASNAFLQPNGVLGAYSAAASVYWTLNVPASNTLPVALPGDPVAGAGPV